MIKKMRTKSISIILCFILLGAPGFAQSHRMSFHANLGISSPTEENIKPALESGFGFALPFTKNMSIILDFGHWNSSVDKEPGKLWNGKLSVNPFLVSFQYSLLQGKTITPYIFLGSSFVFCNFEMGEHYSIPEVSISQKIKNGIGFHAGIGSLIKASDNFSFFAEVLYFYRKSKATTTINDMNFGISTEKFSLSLNAVTLRLGIRYYI